MKIIAVEAIPFNIPLRRSFAFASGRADRLDHVLIRVETDEGVTGHGEAPPRPYTYGESQASIVSVVRTLFADALTGIDPFSREQINALLTRTVNNHAARAAIDIAVWDIIGQVTGRSVHALLGGYAEAVQVAHMVGLGEPAEMVKDALEARANYGITAFKIKVGRTPFEEDIRACAALRTELGDDAELMVDANRGWRGTDALRAIERLSDLGINCVEEPCPADDVLARRRIVERSPLPIVGDESCTRPGEVARMLLERSCDMVSVKTSRTGFTQSQKIVGLCESLGAEMIVGNQIDGSISTLASVSFAAAHRSTAERPAELTMFIDMVDHLLCEPPRIVDGWMAPLRECGLGVAIDPGKLATYRVDI